MRQIGVVMTIVVFALVANGSLGAAGGAGSLGAGTGAGTAVESAEGAAGASGASAAKDLTVPGLAARLEDRELAATGPVVTRYTRDSVKIASQTFRAAHSGHSIEGTLVCRSSCQGPACRGMGCQPVGAACSAYMWSSGSGGSCTRELVVSSRLE